MKEIGQLLKQTREAQGKTLEEISALTKIQLPTLVALEDGDFGRLSNKAFTKGFLRNYAKVLGLDADAIILSLGGPAKPLADVKPVPVSKLDSNELTNKTNLLWFRTPSQFITVGAVVIILGLITSIYFISMKMMSYSQETVQKDVTEVTAETPLEEDLKGDEPGRIEKSAELAGAVTPISTPTPTTTSTSSEPVGTAPAVPVAETPQQDAEESEPPPKGIAPAPETTQKMVAIEARASVNIEAAWSTGKSETIQLNANSRHVFYYLDKIRITVDDGGSVKINTHEKSLGVPGEKSKPITINFR
jgi:cytoskeleton protein RodZ